MVIVAAELLRRANELVKNNIHPTIVMSGYRLALKEAVKYIKSNLVVPSEALDKTNLINAAKTSMSSKILGSEANFFAELAVSAALKVRIESEKKVKCPISNIHILKSHGQSSLNSELVDGYALNCTRAAQGMPSRIHNAKIALLDFGLQKHKMQMGVQVVLTDTKQVEEVRQREMDITKEKIRKILDAGANVILTTKGELFYCISCCDVDVCLTEYPEHLNRN